ncbi:hypothetical protein V2J09_001589 [Rumex salicifolius]
MHQTLYREHCQMQPQAAMAGSSQSPLRIPIAAEHLPLRLLKSESVPPAPNPSECGSTIDWLPDFAGYSWIAYGASSLAVISQFSSSSLPSHQDTTICPQFRQSFDLCSGEVSSVSWSLAPGASSTGDLAAAAGNRIFLFEYNANQGSFCWSQSALLVHTVKVNTIKWTGSGDGIVAGGMDVVFWKKGSVSWEIAWKFEMKQLQSLVSTTWLLEGLSATGTYATARDLHNGGLSPKFSDEMYSVNVFDSDGKTAYFVELGHPQPVSMIQWRTPRAGELTKHAVNQRRNILITSCWDGTVRFWGETGDGRSHKGSRDVSDSRFSRRSFYVVAIIEINQTLNGKLGKDILVNWALELRGIVHMGEGSKFYAGQESEEDTVGRCEWLVALGPGMMLTFWAVHCLDDVAPMRCPRLSLWKRQQLPAPSVEHASDSSPKLFLEKSNFYRVSILRDRLSGPPSACSVVHLLPSNTLGLLMLYSGKSGNTGEQSLSIFEKTDSLLYDAWRILNINGHTGKALKVAVHHCHSKVYLAASLDSNGLLLLWSAFSSNCISGLPSINSSWKPLGNIPLHDMTSRYKSIAWAPSWLDNEWVLLIGHSQGIDCCIVKIDTTEREEILFHKLCTIPFNDGVHVDGPDKLFSIPVHPTCKATFKFNSFMLIGAWSMAFQALSWKITLQCYDVTESRDSDTTDNPGCATCMYESNFAGKRYSIFVNPSSNFLPDCNFNNHVTSFDVVSPSIMMPSLRQLQDLTNDSSPNYITYNMVTGHADGTVRLWRSKLSEVSTVNTPWELVGMFAAHQDPVTSISVADFGQKIATSSSTSDANSEHKLALWEPVNLAGAGCFLLEDEIILREHSSAFSWFPVGNGKFVIGVCFDKELHLYAERRYSGSSLLNLQKPTDRSIWFCISIASLSSSISEFLWGPCATLILIHEKFFSLYGPYMILSNEIISGKSRATEIDNGNISFIHVDSRLCGSEDLLSDEVGSKCQLSERIETSNGLFVQISEEKNDLQTKIGFLSILEVTENFCDPLPLYHPEVLLTHIHSGNWKRACATINHVVESLASSLQNEQKTESAHPPSIITQVKLSNYFEGLSSTSKINKGYRWIEDASFNTTSSHLDGGYLYSAKGSCSSASSSSELNDFLQILDKSHYLLAITDKERMQTCSIVDLLKEISNLQSASVYEGLDDPGRRFWCSVRLQQLICLRRLGRMPSTAEIDVNSRLIAWAFHSDCQDNLFNAVLPPEPSWRDMQSMGFGYWFTNAVQIRAKMEKLARSQYLKSRDPKACTLLYIALNRLQVLAGLFKISKNEKDKAMVGFLSRNFQEEKHKAAALKNAYVLMGKHELELAIAFFILGGDTMSAVNVCAKTLGDEQLALVICRLIDGQGGTLERNLISKIILPSSIEKGDYWLSSVLEWLLGNYCQAFLSTLGIEKDAATGKASNTFRCIALLDPSIGQFCQKMVAKNSLRNAVGEQNATILSKWATVVATAALNKCGQPLEALECLSSSSSNPAIMTQGICGESSELLPKTLRPTSTNSSNWVSGQVVFHLETVVKSDLAMQYISKLLWEHSSWSNMKVASDQGSTSSQNSEVHQYRNALEELQPKLNSSIGYLEQKFSLIPIQVVDKILFSLSNHGLVLVGYHILNGLFSQDHPHALDPCANFQISSSLLNELHAATQDVAQFLTQFIAACSVASSHSNIAKYMNDLPMRQSWIQFVGLGFYMQGLCLSLDRVKASLSVLGNANVDHLTSHAFYILDFCKYCACLAYVIQQRDCQALDLLLQPIMISHSDGNISQFDITNIREILILVSKHMDMQIIASRCKDLKGTKFLFHGSSTKASAAIPGDAWEIAGACMWQHVSHFMVDMLDRACEKPGMSSTSCGLPESKSLLSSSSFQQLDDPSLVEHIQLVSATFAESVRNTVTLTCSYYTQQLALLMWKKLEAGIPIPTHWLEDYSQSRRSHSHMQINTGAHIQGTESSEILCAESAMISQLLAKSGLDLSHFTQRKPFSGWENLHVGVFKTREVVSSQLNQEVVQNAPSGGNKIESDADVQPQSGQSFQDLDRREGSIAMNSIPLKNPREIFRKNGDLLEALCVNSIDQRQAALAIDRKGIVFFNWDDGLALCDRSEYVWLEADWPYNGWAGTESTPVRTYVSHGVGLGNKKGAHLGLGGATVGSGSLRKPRSDLTGGGAFGIPGYAGIGASGLGWEIQDDFEKFVDPLATVENVNTQALYAHPSRDLFLVGSRNTHIYLWKFGDEKATATYGVLPTANVPPPYALASVTALQFDRCGQRFANAASDGTVCTWQLGVGGRSNVRPTESSICFSGQASDISYVSTSGSIIAVAGYSSNGVNVVVWDTLAPPASSRASVMCHEGGASSIAVFDNDVGSGSISPLIVSGGKGGDVGLHDFRYIATGKTKRHRHPNIVEHVSDTSFAESRPYSNMGDHNRNGMLWYIPNAHSGSITKISTIPNTSLFLTGSKDGDVKLWDAKKAKMVFHWPKLHERHTFLQRSSSGFGSVKRVGLTDIRVVSNGFVSCGGDGSVKFTQLGDQARPT